MIRLRRHDLAGRWCITARAAVHHCPVDYQAQIPAGIEVANQCVVVPGDLRAGCSERSVLAMELSRGAAILVLACIMTLGALALGGAATFPQANMGDPGHGELDAELERVLAQAGFTGRIESTLESRLGRHVDKQLADLGRLLWFDTITGLNNDNTCAGCHSPTHGFGDTQSIAIGIDNNGIVGPDRRGAAQSTPLAHGHQHGLLPEADVELALRLALGRSVR